MTRGAGSLHRITAELGATPTNMANPTPINISARPQHPVCLTTPFLPGNPNRERGKLQKTVWPDIEFTMSPTRESHKQSSIIVRCR